jgi:hypothetical protein
MTMCSLVEEPSASIFRVKEGGSTFLQNIRLPSVEFEKTVIFNSRTNM